MTRSRFVDAGGVRLRYLDHGGDGPPLVLMHGLTANAHFFDGLARAGLAPALRVLAFDLRGRGQSDKPADGYSMAEHAADLVGAFDALGLERLLLGGHSFGGLLTTWIAAHHPERVERALVLDAPAEVDATVLDQIGPSLARLEQTYPAREAYLEAVRAQPYFAASGWNADLESYYDGDVEELPGGSVRSRCRPDQIRQAVEGTARVDWRGLAGRVRCPVLLLRTTEPFGPPGSPPLMSEEQAREAVAAFADARLVEVPGNHVTFASGKRASGVAESILEFVFADAAVT